MCWSSARGVSLTSLDLVSTSWRQRLKSLQKTSSQPETCLTTRIVPRNPITPSRRRFSCLDNRWRRQLGEWEDRNTGFDRLKPWCSVLGSLLDLALSVDNGILPERHQCPRLY